MKRWAIVTVTLYAVNLLVLTMPVFALALGSWWGKAGGPNLDWPELTSVYQKPFYWLWFSTLVISQTLLLVVPVRITTRRLQPQRPLILPVAVTSFLLGNLFLAGLLTVVCLVIGDHGLDIFFDFIDFLTKWAPSQRLVDFLAAHTKLSSKDWELLGFALIYVAMFWGLWGMIFFHCSRKDTPDDMIRRSTRWLLRGSILELLVTIPSHVIIRNRDSCCAPAASFWGIVTGLSVMLLAYGPGVLFLFAERVQRSKLRNSSPQPDARPAPLPPPA